MKTFVQSMLSALLIVFASAAAAEPAGQEPSFMSALFPPDLIMEHQQQLKISDHQRDEILAAITKFQAEASELQWTMLNEQQKLGEIISAPGVSQSAVLTQAKKVMGVETQFKLAHLKLLLTIKMLLTEEQIDALVEIRRGD